MVLALVALATIRIQCDNVHRVSQTERRQGRTGGGTNSNEPWGRIHMEDASMCLGVPRYGIDRGAGSLIPSLF